MLHVLKFLCALVVFSSSGCVVKRTVKEDGVTVAQGYVFKRQ